MLLPADKNLPAADGGRGEAVIVDRGGTRNAMSEGFNSRIQSIKSQARGFLAFDNYRIRILFYCGKLDLVPSEITH